MALCFIVFFLVVAGAYVGMWLAGNDEIDLWTLYCPCAKACQLLLSAIIAKLSARSKLQEIRQMEGITCLMSAERAY